MRTRVADVIAGAFLLLAADCGPDASEDPEQAGSPQPSGTMVLASTTSTQDSGLLDVLVPAFEESKDCAVKTVAVGSGAAIQMGVKGDADALLVHSPAAEKKFMDAGHGLSRKPVMHNDFVIVGPPKDPANVADSDNAADALSRIADTEAEFASRADESGTNAKELALWDETNLDPSGSWYIETGQGMGETLTVANQKQAYTLTDRGTFLSSKNLDSQILFQGSKDLYNPYHVMVVDHEGTNTACAQAFSEWIRAKPTQQTISEFGVERYDQPLFFPDVHK